MSADLIPFPTSDDLERQLDAILSRTSPFRDVAHVVYVTTAGFRAVDGHGFDAQDLKEIAPYWGELYAHPAAPRAMLDDPAFDLEAWLADEIGRDFGVAEGAAFVAGSGVNQPKGFLRGDLRILPSGAEGAFGADAENRLIDVVQALAPRYRQGAAWMMNSATLARVRALQTSDGAFLWAPGLAKDRPSTLLGYPVIEIEDMPDIAPGSLSIAFGNFKAGYLVADRATSILRDAATSKPFVHFFASRRVGGTVRDHEAIKLMRFSER